MSSTSPATESTPAEPDAAVATGAEAAARTRLDLDVDLVVAFLNTTDAETGHDVLDDQQEWQRWCAERELGPVPNAGDTRSIRDGMRVALTGAAQDGAAGWPIRVGLKAGIPTLESEDALGTILASATRIVHIGHWDRLKICPAHDCLWAFYDRSRNRSRSWCDMKVCGNREKARSWRQRRT